ncbi:MAG: DUF4003 family protein [Bacillus sp. (in: firmicutes)]
MPANMMDIFVRNDQAIKESFKWENQLIRKFSAFQLALAGQEVDRGQVKAMKEYIKQKTSAFSYFRSHNLFPIAVSLTSEEQPEHVFDQTVQYYEELKEAGFRRSMYLPYAAYFLASHVPQDEVKLTVEKALNCHQLMKQEHFWLTSDDDYMLAFILAYSHDDMEKAVHDSEECYDYLNRNGMGKGNTLQTIGYLLSLSKQRAADKCDCLLWYIDELKQHKIKLDSYSRPLLALLATVEEDRDEIVKGIIGTDKELASKDGFGRWSLGRASRNMFSVALVLSQYLQNGSQASISATIQNSIQSVLLAQQAAMVGAIAASTAASSSSSSS